MNKPRITHWKSRAAQGLNAHVVVFNGQEKFFATKAEAQAHYDLIVIEEDKGGHITSKDAATLDTAIKEFIKHTKGRIKKGVASAGQLIEHNKAIRALRQIEIDGKNFDDVLVSDLTAADLQFTILEGLFEGRSPKSVHNYFSTLRAILKFSVVKGWATSNLALNVTVKDVVGKGSSDSEKAEKIGGNVIAAILDASGDWATAINFAKSTGLRQGEQRALKWKHIDFDRGFVKVIEAIKVCETTGDTKTKAGSREVPLQDSTIAQLRELRLASKYSGDEDYVFNIEGALLTHSRCYKALQRACKKAGVPSIRWHDLRHYFASKLLENLQDELWTVSRLLGHNSIDTTTRIYAHWLQSDERDRKLKDRFAAINF